MSMMTSGGKTRLRELIYEPSSLQGAKDASLNLDVHVCTSELILDNRSNKDMINVVKEDNEVKPFLFFVHLGNFLIQRSSVDNQRATESVVRAPAWCAAANSVGTCHRSVHTPKVAWARTVAARR